MGDPYVREVGTVDDMDDQPTYVGVDHDVVTVHTYGVARFTRAAAEEFAHLFVAACWEAGQNARRMGEEVHEADGGDSMAGCDALSGELGSVWECTETGPHRVHLARNTIDGTIMHAWEDRDG